MTIRIKEDPHEYDVKDRECIGRPCLNLHPIQVMGAAGAAGLRFTGQYHYACGRRDYHGCPAPIPEYQRKLEAERRKEGMRNA